MVTALFLVSGGYWFYQRDREQIRMERYRELAAIADLKVNQIIAWRQERLEDARIHSTGLIRSYFLQWSKTPGEDLRARLLARMNVISRLDHYDNVIIANGNGRVLFTVNPRLVELEGYSKGLLREALADKKVIFGDFFRRPTDNQVHQDVLAPLLDDKDRAVAVLILRIDPRQFIYPLIQSWPTPSKTAETLLVRREGDQVLFLNQLRHRPDPPLSIKIPLESTEVPAVQAVLGKTGLFAGRDYRGVEVIADLRPIEGLPWFLITKIDRNEILAEAAYRGRAVAIFVLLSLLLAGIFMALLYNRRLSNINEALYLSERERLKTMEEIEATLYSIGDGVIVADAAGRITRMNPVAEHLLGWPEAEALGQPLGEVFRIVDEKTGRVVENPAEKPLRERRIINYDSHVLVSRDGSRRPFADSAAPIRTENGQTAGAVFVFRDQTIERENRKTLEREKYLAQQYLDIAGVMILALDTAGRVALINRKGCEILGLPPEEILGKNWFDHFLPPRERERIKVVFNQIVAGEIETAEYVENPVLLPSGEERLISWHNTLVRDEEGRIIGTLSSGEDITERKRIEAALKASEERFRELFDNAPVGYHELDSEGRITDVNRTELMMLGYAKEEMIGQPVWKFIAEEEQSRQSVLAVLAGTRPPRNDIERTYVRKDGTILPVVISGELLRTQEGKITGIRATIQDITERKRAEEERSTLEEQLRQSQKMEAIGRLAGGVAHDFNNILTVIFGYCDLAFMTLKEQDPLQPLMKGISEAAARAKDLTQQLLAFSRKQILEMRVLDLNEVLEKLEKMLSRLIGEDIELVTIKAESPGRVKGDRGQLEQVLINLAVNARDAMPEGGKLIIEVTNVELDERYTRTHTMVQPGPYVLISISDTGCGMTEEVKERIFEPFFTTKERGKGTGLGLSTVYGIVKQLDGHIWVYSEPGQGTTFKIYLPRVEERADEVKEEVAPEITGGGETILVVEDDEFVRRLAVTILQNLGYRVREAPNGQTALQLCQESGEPIDLLLTDVVMPEMSGSRLAEQIKELHPQIKTLYMSGYTDNAIVHHGILDAGVNFLQKPFTVAALAKTVREVLGR